jgi:hypothetical protein
VFFAALSPACPKSGASPGRNFFKTNELQLANKNNCKNYIRPLICGLTAYSNPLKFAVVYQAADEKMHCSWIILQKSRPENAKNHRCPQKD